jgi:hypothetical protein
MVWQWGAGNGVWETYAENMCAQLDATAATRTDSESYRADVDRSQGALHASRNQVYKRGFILDMVAVDGERIVDVAQMRQFRRDNHSRSREVRKGWVGVIKKNYTETYKGAIPAKRGEIVLVLDETSLDWWRCSLRDPEQQVAGITGIKKIWNRTGFIPASYIARPAAPEPEPEPEPEPAKSVDDPDGARLWLHENKFTKAGASAIIEVIREKGEAISPRLLRGLDLDELRAVASEHSLAPMMRLQEINKEASTLFKEAQQLSIVWKMQTKLIEVVKKMSDVMNQTNRLEPAVRVMVFGEGKNGKSTVLNALLGEELLPSGGEAKHSASSSSHTGEILLRQSA